MDEKILIKFTNFTFRYHSLAKPSLENINLEINSGDKVLIVGRSGSGKSTLLHAINGIIPFANYGETSGSLIINGNDDINDSIFSRSKVVGTILQDMDSQFIGLSVGEDVAFSLENEQIDNERIHATVKQSLEEVAMLDFIGHSPYELSGGQKQRVSLAGILASSPEVLLFDEPLANLDPASAVKITSLIKELNHTTRKTVVIAEHRLEECLEIEPDYIVVMDGGQIVKIAKPDEILASGILNQLGIREPLYCELLKYSCLETSVSKLADVIDLDNQKKQRIIDWFNSTYLAESLKKEIKEPPIFSARDISFAYQDNFPTLKNISFDLHKGEIVSILGNNGAGKSTLTCLMSGIYSPRSGVMTLNGEDISSWTIKKRGQYIALIMQNPNQMIVKTLVWDEVAFCLENQGVELSQIKRRVENTLRVCGLWGYRSWPISALSYGQKKRVTIAAMLVLEPEILILDEPTAGQDLKTYREFMEFLQKLAASGLSILIITHDLYLAMEYTSRTMVLMNGELIADKDPASILADDEIIRLAGLHELSPISLAKKLGLNPKAFLNKFLACRER